MVDKEKVPDQSEDPDLQSPWHQADHFPCPGCKAWESGNSEVNFVQGCPECWKHMGEANGIYK